MIHDMLLAVVWYLTMTCFGMLVLPVAMIVFRRMPEGGILLSRPFGWLTVSFIAWWLAYIRLLPFSSLGLWIVTITLLVVSIYLTRVRGPWLARQFQRCWRTALNGELVTLAFFILLILARREDPAIGSTEKPMDIMMLNAMVNFSEIPPPDPWLAGYTINYHYGGYVLHSVPTQLTGIAPEYAYNLVIATVAGLGAGIAFVLGRLLFGRCRWAIIVPLAIFMIGNLEAFSIVWWKATFPNNLYEWRFGYLWDTSRVIYDAGQHETINEYPLFTLLWGDLHPHFSNIPFMLLFMVTAAAIVLSLFAIHPPRSLKYEWPLYAAFVMTLGFILPTNVFDFPIMALLYAGTILAALLYYFFCKHSNWPRWAMLASLLALPALSYLAALPFWRHFVRPGEGSLIQWSPYHSTLFQFLLLFGLHTVATLALLLFRLTRQLQSFSKEEVLFLLALFSTFVVVIWGWTGHWMCALAPFLAAGLWIWTAARACRAGKENDASVGLELFALTACALAWSMIAGCEFIYLKDNYSSPRMNTLFKIHFPVWFLLGVSLPYLLRLEFIRMASGAARWCYLAPVLLLFAVSLVPGWYTFWGLYRLPDANTVKTLDGLAFMKQSTPHQYAVIDWVRNNAAPGDIVLEVAGCAYSSSESSVSAFTGRATVVGWVNHETLWRAGEMDQEVLRRKAEIDRFYTTTNWEEAKSILQKYKIKYVAFIPPECQEKRAMKTQMQNSVFRNHVKPILYESGPAFGYPDATFELYEVPESFQ